MGQVEILIHFVEKKKINKLRRELIVYIKLFYARKCPVNTVTSCCILLTCHKLLRIPMLISEGPFSILSIRWEICTDTETQASDEVILKSLRPALSLKAG